MFRTSFPSLATAVLTLGLIASQFSNALEPNPSGEMTRAVEVPDVEEVRRLLHWEGPLSGPRPLIGLGQKVFPALESILADPKSKPGDVARAFGLLNTMEMDRRRFLELAVGRLADPSSSVRWAALGLLKQIGTERDCAPVVVLLFDQDIAIRRSAAETLGVIGGKRELAVMDVWLRIGDHRSDGDLVRRVQEQRDLLKKRLNAEAKKLLEGS